MTIVVASEKTVLHDNPPYLVCIGTTQALIEWALGLTSEDIRRIAETHRACASVADDVDWWRATARVRRLLRARRRSRAAASAAANAAQAVQVAARSEGHGQNDPDVIAAARATGDAACALAAGEDARAEAAYFLARLCFVQTATTSR